MCVRRPEVVWCAAEARLHHLCTIGHPRWHLSADAYFEMCDLARDCHISTFLLGAPPAFLYTFFTHPLHNFPPQAPVGGGGAPEGAAAGPSSGEGGGGGGGREGDLSAPEAAARLAAHVSSYTTMLLYDIYTTCNLQLCNYTY